MLDTLLERLRQSDRLALARLLTLAARGEQLNELRSAIPPPVQGTRTVAITGSGGVGKSTLIGRLIELLRKQNQTVAVLACDPQSPLSGGALLGDRFRMPAKPDDEGIFIRSLAAAAGHGAVADHLDVMLRIVSAFGFDVVLIETVGAGQGDTLVRELADVVILLLQPETGDDLQWEKAGLLEIADIIAINKGDLPMAEQVEAQVRATLGLANGQQVPVIRVSAKTGEGIEALWAAVAASESGHGIRFDPGHPLLLRAQESLASWFASAQADQHPDLQQLIAGWQQGTLGEEEAIQILFDLMARGGSVLR